MKTDASDPLLRAVLGDGADFHATTLNDVRRLARGRRRGRELRRALAAAGLIMGAAILIYSRNAPIRQETRSESFASISSEPLLAGEIVRTKEGWFSLVDRRPEGLRLVATTPAGIDVFETRMRETPPAFLDDRQLLNAFPGRRVALIDPGTASARLIIY